ncbi:unnamed protein product [Rhizoctonia solani]|uniref:Transmembrane protein n=1 Tax=Rhizoctonia solani TaxID=456999 RepID=A0A8H3BJJ0_9AGAM|nr:unnamed protein product [Rhizoctonia solani]CAE6497183.1 unnamed protein product [Rhizoctonia solani]
MLAFSRLTSFILFVLSLSLFTYALPAPGASGALSTRDAKCDQLVDIVVGLKTKVDTCISAALKAEVVADVTAQLNLVVGHVESCAHAVVAIGPVTDIDDIVKADVAAKVAAIIAVILKACLRLSIKFGLQVLLDLFAKIDVVLKLLLVNLGACVDGIVILVSKIAVATCAHILAKLNFKLCLNTLALVNVGIY